MQPLRDVGKFCYNHPAVILIAINIRNYLDAKSASNAKQPLSRNLNLEAGCVLRYIRTPKSTFF